MRDVNYRESFSIENMFENFDFEKGNEISRYLKKNSEKLGSQRVSLLENEDSLMYKIKSFYVMGDYTLVEQNRYIEFPIEGRNGDCLEISHELVYHSKNSQKISKHFSKLEHQLEKY